jgi:hypothetical protein
MRSLVVLIIAARFSIAHAQDPTATLLHHIASTPFFAFGGVGYAGVMSSGEADFHMLMMQSKAAALQSFEKLYATGDGEAKAYALAGIRELNPAESDQLMNSLQHSSEKISTMEGCILRLQSLGDVASRLKAGNYDHWIKSKRLPSRPHAGGLGGYIDQR